MDVESLAKQLILKGMTEEQQNAVLDSIKTTMGNARTVQKQRIGENVQVVVQALKKIEADIKARYDETGKAIEKRVASIKDGRDGRDGVDGRAGKDGRPGRDGAVGPRGIDGLNGSDGVDGVDGISITDAHIDFDGSLIITLSDGKLLNVGEVVSQDIVEKINVISTMSTNAALTIEDEGSSISGAVRTINFVGAAVTASASGDEVTVNVSSGTGTVTSVAVSGGTTGLTTSGGPITTTGTITLAGTLAVASGGTGTATPGLVAGTNITSITGSWPNQTINAGGGSGTVTSVAATVPAFLSVTGSPITTSGTLAIGLSGTALPVANGGTGVTTSTGTTNVVLSNSPVLVTPDLGTPSALVGTNITGTATAFTASNVTTNANLTGAVTSVGNSTSLGSFTSAQLLGALTDETGTGAAVFATSPTLVTPALGTPASGVVTNLTGTASININGTVGATTPAAGAFTTLSATGVTTVQAGTAASPAITTTGDTNTGIFFPAADTIAFAEGGAEAMRITSAGDVGIGTSSPAFGDGSGIEVSRSGTATFRATSNSQGVEFRNNAGTAEIDTRGAFPIKLLTNQIERARIDSSGNVGIGTSSPTRTLDVSAASATVFLTSSTGTNRVYYGTSNTGGGTYFGRENSAGTSFGSSAYASVVWSEGAYPLVFATNNTERMRIDSSGNFMVNKTTISSTTGDGIYVQQNTGQLGVVATSDVVIEVNRNTTDGTLVNFRQAGTSEGTISVSGTTVSYNGGHLSRWAQTTTAKDDTLVKGTVLSNLDEMNVYVAPTTYWAEEDELPEDVSVGDVKVETHQVDNEQLNKVKVSDVEGDANVAGVFVNWDHDEAHNIDEINMAMTGDMIIRIAQGTTVARGDLLMSAGDGTAKPQGDDIVRSKTVAKVTSTHVTCTYADGSYCVPCVLMAC